MFIVLVVIGIGIGEGDVTSRFNYPTTIWCLPVERDN